MADESAGGNNRTTAFVISARKRTLQKAYKTVGEGLLLAVGSFVAIVVLFIFYFVARDAIPFFQIRGFSEFFTSTNWYPADQPGGFGALAIIYGSLMVTLGSALIAVPMGVAAAVCLSDILPFSIRQYAKPVIEMLAAIPSVAFGFFALVVLAPLLQNNGGPMLMWAWWILVTPFLLLAILVVADLLTANIKDPKRRQQSYVILLTLFCLVSVFMLYKVGTQLYAIQILTAPTPSTFPLFSASWRCRPLSASPKMPFRLSVVTFAKAVTHSAPHELKPSLKPFSLPPAAASLPQSFSESCAHSVKPWWSGWPRAIHPIFQSPGSTISKPFGH